MARDEAQHGTFSEPTRTDRHTTTQRGTVPSCIDMVHRRKTHIVVVGGDETQQAFKYKECFVVDLVLSELTKIGCMALEGMTLQS